MVHIYFNFTTWENGTRLGLSEVQSWNFRFSINKIAWTWTTPKGRN